MKKLLFLLVAALPIMFFSCSDDDDKDSDGLSGTTWEYSESILGYTFSSTIEFRSSTTFKLVSTDDEGSDTITGTYTYNHPNIVLSSTQIDTDLEGVRSGNKITFTEVDPEDGETFIMVFTKK